MTSIGAVLAALAVFAAVESQAQVTQPSPNLRIVVIEGEDVVNIIQQKTAVRPIVEVRDRNNLPVAGATVVFTIQGGGGTSTAAFANGQSVFTATTSGAGRATVSELQALRPGTVQIQVRANYQGQVATQTINQRNYATTADALAKKEQLPQPNAEATDVVSTIGTVGGIAAAGLGAAMVVKETANARGCQSLADAALSQITAAVDACASNTSAPQCDPAVQQASISLGEWCSCDGRVNVDAALAREGVTLQQLDEAAGSRPRVPFPASCR